MKHLFNKTILALITILTVSLCIYSCGSSNNTLKVGDEVYLDNCLSASTEDNFKELNSICNKRDESALTQGMSEGMFKEMEKYTTGKVVELGLAKCKVQILDDDSTWWISSEFVHKLK